MFAASSQPQSLADNGDSGCGRDPPLSTTATATATAAHRHRRSSPVSTTGSVSSSTTFFSKKRGREGGSSSPMVPDVFLQSAIAQASQVCSKFGYHGLAQLLAQRSNAAGTVDGRLTPPTNAATGLGSGSNNSGNLFLPTILQVQQAATKAHQEQPPWIHWSKSDMAAQSCLRVTGHRVELQASLSGARGGAGGYRMARANVGTSVGSYYYEVWISEAAAPTTDQILQSLPLAVRLAPTLRKALQSALEYQERQQKEPAVNTSSASSASLPVAVAAFGATTAATHATLQNQVCSSTVVGSAGSSPAAAAKLEGTTQEVSSEVASGDDPPTKKARTEGRDAASNTNVTSGGGGGSGGGGTLTSGNTMNHHDPPKRVGGHVRLGWSMRTGDLQAPVGYDRWSFAIRDIGGSIITNSQRIDNWVGAEGFGPGDVIGCAISLYGKEGSDPPDESPNAIRFFKNGICMGEFVVAKGKRSGGEAPFPCDIPAGTYYPAVSCYLGGAVRANFGPKFVYPPRKLPTGLKLAPLSDLSMPPETNVPTIMAQMASILKMMRSAGGQKNADVFTQALQEAVQTEARILHDAYVNFQRQNLLEVRQERVDRGLAVQDLDALLEEHQSNSNGSQQQIKRGPFGGDWVYY